MSRHSALGQGDGPTQDDRSIYNSTGGSCLERLLLICFGEDGIKLDQCQQSLGGRRSRDVSGREIFEPEPHFLRDRTHRLVKAEREVKALRERQFVSPAGFISSISEEGCRESARMRA